MRWEDLGFSIRSKMCWKDRMYPCNWRNCTSNDCIIKRNGMPNPPRKEKIPERQFLDPVPTDYAYEIKHEEEFDKRVDRACLNCVSLRGTEDDLICGMHLKKTRLEGYCGKHNFQLSLDGSPTTGPLPFSEDELEKIRPRLIRVSMQ